MGFSDAVPQLIITQFSPIVALNPSHPTRSQIGRWSASWDLSQGFIVHFGGLERDAWYGIVLGIANRKDLITHFPNIRIIPLHYMMGGGQIATELVEFIAFHSENLINLRSHTLTGRSDKLLNHCLNVL
jgi:hypothetical protein